MKNKLKIYINLTQKIGLWLAGKQWQSDELKEHIRMLDWVVSTENMRDIDTIVKTYSGKTPAEMLNSGEDITLKSKKED